MARLKAGIIGLGIGEKHIPAFNAHPACEVRALCDFSKERLSATGKLYPKANLTMDAIEILEDPEIDLISVASFDNFHFHHVDRAVRNGKHVFVEKPLCLHRHEALSIRRSLGQNPDIRLSSNLNLRTCPRFIRMREAILSGELGEIFHMEGDYLWGRTHKLTNGWRKDMELYSIIYGAAVHMIDLLMWITGKRPAEVQGYGNRIATANSEFRFNDFAMILMKFKNGMTAKVTANGGCVHPHFHRVAVFGTKKTFLNDISGAKLLESRDPDAKLLEVLDEYPAVEEKGKVITTFIDAVLDKAKPLVSGDDVFATMSVCFAAEEAVLKKKPIKIEYL